MKFITGSYLREKRKPVGRRSLELSNYRTLFSSRFLFSRGDSLSLFFPFFSFFFFFFSFFISRSPLCEAKCRAHASNARFFAEIEIGNNTVYEESSRIYHGPRVLRAVCWDRWWVKPRKSETSRAKETILRKCGIISIYAFLRNTRLRTSERNFVWNLNYAQTFA